MLYNSFMDNVVPFFTKDGSVGLYNKKEDDIYHSVYGALTEAYDKFIIPANFDAFFDENNEIKILDLCYGIGYNTKVFLNNLLKKYLNEKKHINSIDSDNVIANKNIYSIDNDNILLDKCINSLYNNKIFKKYFRKSNIKNNLIKKQKFKVYIDAVDTNKNLVKMSPFFKVAGDIKINKRLSGIDKIDKYLKDDFYPSEHFDLLSEVNILILYFLINNFASEYVDDGLSEILNDKKYSKFIDSKMKAFLGFYFKKHSNLYSNKIKCSFLHNIYYSYISNSYKNTLKVLENNEISINYIIEDARQFLSKSNLEYDFIFLDAFSPSKCPSLWTYDFIKLLYKNLSENGKILTYTNSSAVRNAFLKNNFFIEKIYNKSEERYTGLIAAKQSKIVNPNLSRYELGLLDTKSSIMYRDENLLLNNKEILENRKKELLNSNLMSSTKYIKNFKGDKNEI